MQNYKILRIVTPFRGLLLSAAYLMPFLMDKGFTQTEIFMAQAVFSLTAVSWGIPSGYIADRFGRALCIKIGTPMIALGFLLYGFSDQLWQFMIIEVILAIADGLISGIDTALLIDSLKHDGRERDYKKLNLRIQMSVYIATAVSVPASMLVIYFANIETAIIVDSIMILFGALVAFRLKDVPHATSQNTAKPSAISAFKEVARTMKRPNIAWMLATGVALSTVSYMAYWLTPQYLTSMGVPLVVFSGIFAVRSLLSAWVARNIDPEYLLKSFRCAAHNPIAHQSDCLQCTARKASERRRLIALLSYAILGLLSFIAMASGQWFLVFFIFGHDIVQVLHNPIITEQINSHFSSENRAMLNSTINLIRRFVFAVVGLIVGAIVDRFGLVSGLIATGIMVSVLPAIAIWQLSRAGQSQIIRTFWLRLRAARV